jgi:beta-glucosidase/6-phospho-beta-glucosidase/beta-galactosidase
MADEWRYWHSTQQDVYHDSTFCTTGNNIEEEYLCPGRGGRRRCRECARIDEEMGRVEDLPDLSGATFDRRLPDGTTRTFLWGVATAGQQVEGSLTKSDWASYTKSARQQARVHQIGELGATDLKLESPDPGTEHWKPEVFAAELDRAAALGLSAYRLSIEWSRVQPDAPAWATTWITDHKNKSTDDMNGEEPDPGAFDAAEFDPAALQRYAEMVDAVVERGMEPIVTLNHLALPAWVLKAPTRTVIVDLFGQIVNDSTVEDSVFWGTLRGWETRATIAAFLRYVRAVVSKLPEVGLWLTFNEPVSTLIGSCYLAGVWPPGFMGDGKKAVRVYERLIEAHTAAYDLIHELEPGALVGCSQWIAAAYPAPQTIAQKLLVGDNVAAKNQWEYFNSFYFLDAVTTGGQNKDVWRKTTPTVRDDWKGRLDFVALQYYRSAFVFHDIPLSLACPAAGGRFKLDVIRDESAEDYLKERLSNDLGWTIDPGGFYDVLMTFWKRYGLPILVTENGIAESEDRNRGPFIVAHLQSVLRAINDGVDIRGYIHWTITDNWEWTYDYQPFARFGLFTLERPTDAGDDTPTPFRRRITRGALAYSSIVSRARRAGAAIDGDLFAPLVTRFGSIEPTGRQLVHATEQSGGFWNGRWHDDSKFVLYLTRFTEDEWHGLIYDAAKDEWRRLADVQWTATNRSGGRLTFTDPSTNEQFAAETRRTHNASDPDLTGEAVGGAHAFKAERAALLNTFKRSSGPSDPIYVQLSRFEPDAPWHVAVASRFGPWQVATAVIVDDQAGVVAFTMPDGRDFKGRLQGGRLTGAFAGATTWAGRPLPDNLRFA